MANDGVDELIAVEVVHYLMDLYNPSARFVLLDAQGVDVGSIMLH